VQHLQQTRKPVFHKALQRMSAAPLAAMTGLDDLWLDGHFTDRGAPEEQRLCIPTNRLPVSM
jgi:hypothetical protein